VIDNIIIPSRFESLIDNERVKAQPTLVPVESDLKYFDYLIEKVRVQNGGVLAFGLGKTGIGKSIKLSISRSERSVNPSIAAQ